MTAGFLKATSLIALALGLTLGFKTLVTNSTSTATKTVIQTQPSITSRTNVVLNTVGQITTDSTTVSGNSVSKNDDPVKVVQSVKKIKNLDLPLDRTIYLPGEIGANAIQASEVITSLAKQSSEPIYLVLEGPGGSVLAGAKLIAAMQASKAPVYTVCQVICASMDFMIHQYGVKRYAVDRAILMGHPAAGSAEGDVDRMVSMNKMLQRFTNKMEADVSAKMGISFEQYKYITGQNLWVDAEDSIDMKLTDEIVSISLQGVHVVSNMGSDKIRNTKRTNPLDFQWVTKGFESLYGDY